MTIVYHRLFFIATVTFTQRQSLNTYTKHNTSKVKTLTVRLLFNAAHMLKIRYT